MADADPHKVDTDPWLRPLQKRVGAKKWVGSRRRCSKDFYYSSIDEWRKRWMDQHGTEPSDATLAGLVAVIAEGNGELRAHARQEDVQPASATEWADMTQAASWYLVEQYYKDVAKGKWP